jgi:hypothetical protein
MKAVVAAYNDTADVKAVQSTGVTIAGQKYIVIKADDRSLYGKKVSQHTAKWRRCAMRGMEDKLLGKKWDIG